MRRVAITGGMGSGKSTVCRLFSVLGAEVYDSDSRAKRLMVENGELVAAIRELFGDDAYTQGRLNRQYISERVFADREALARLEGLVHPTVRRDFSAWAASVVTRKGYVIMESAILFESGMDGMFDSVVTVSSPEQLRIARSVSRDGSDREAVARRIRSQMSDERRERLADYVVLNDEEHSLIEQVLRLDELFSK